jgi:ADP-ribose pyrophosphatase YjhB (NUDIX family)
VADRLLTHAGGIVRRDDQPEPRFLLVRASRAPFDWVIPKGHIEAGETPEQTARREVREEAAVDAEVERQVGDLSFEVRGRTIHVRYFAMRYRSDVPPQEGREVGWCSLAECEQRLLFEDAREMVRRAGPGLAAKPPG